jgi:hypothetical protein
MPQKTLDGEDVLGEDNLWAEGSFSETMGPKDWELKKRTFLMKHNEEKDYDCKQCNTKISAHNNDWHAGLCDKCFDKIIGD